MSMERQAQKARNLGVFERYLTLWVLICMAVGTILGFLIPGFAEFLAGMELYNVSIPIGILLFFMIYPIMVQIDFQTVVDAIRAPKPVVITLGVNWAIKPFSMAFLAWLFMRVIWAPLLDPVMAGEYIAGMILLGIAPCTAMVLVWSYLARGNMGHTLVMVAINSLTMLFFYAPLGTLLLSVAEVPVPFMTIMFSVGFYVGLPLLAGFITRTQLIRTRGIDWYESVFLRYMGRISIVALLVTLVVLFILQGRVIVAMPLIILLIAVPLLIQTFLIFFLGYGISRAVRIDYEDAAPTAMIGASNHFEVAIAVATLLFGLDSGAALATVVGVLIEVPVMLALVRICLRTKHWFPSKYGQEPQ
ncbi:MAG: ACR3 family arsenite efflux transporter [Bacillota bacterium]|nr:ACR3 family arsenite efflux transporter [Bacillota bacterium]MDW7683073.1 ACR3 family arsenite efflux transporter [Bacillota bacterium]